jgi:transketolase
LPETKIEKHLIDPSFEKDKTYATREVFGEAITQAGKKAGNIYVMDADVKNSTFTEDFMKAIPERFIECYIAEQKHDFCCCRFIKNW